MQYTVPASIVISQEERTGRSPVYKRKENAPHKEDGAKVADEAEQNSRNVATGKKRTKGLLDFARLPMVEMREKIPRDGIAGYLSIGKTDNK